LTINLKLELTRPYELAAFGEFCHALAAKQAEWEKDNPRPSLAGALLGSISRDPSPHWRAMDADTAQATVAEHRDTFEAPEGYEAVRDEAGRATGEVRPVVTDGADKRAVGEASGGRKRRTKDEIAADDALIALAVAKGVSLEKLNNVIGEAGRAVARAELDRIDRATDATAAEAKAAISTGENRVGPEDDPETEAQDATDEAAEVEATRKASATIDDVKAAVQLYVDKFGLKFTQEDGPAIFVEALGKPPAGEAFWKFSILPDDAEKLAHVVSVWERAAAENPLKRETV